MDTLTDQQTTIKDNLFTLVHKLDSQAYKDRKEQMLDAVKVGQLASAWLSIEDARNNLRKAHS